MNSEGKKYIGTIDQDTTSTRFIIFNKNSRIISIELLMQFQADILNIPVIRPKITETTVLGATYTAGLAVGFWKNKDQLRKNWIADKKWSPKMNSNLRQKLFNK